MNFIKTILVDDEPRGLSSLKKLLEFNCPEVEIIATCSSADEAVEKIKELKPQLVFLDINMPQKSGFDLLNEIDKRDFEIIFVTAHNNYMLQAFQYSAVDYLLKPVDEDLLKQAVSRAAQKSETKQEAGSLETLLHNIAQKENPAKMKLCISSLKGFQVVEIQDIIYCEANSNYTNFHFTNRPLICTSKPIHEYETLLSDQNFVRIHKSFVVNLQHVTEYIRGEGGSVVLSNGQEIEVSRRKKELLMSKMKAFFKF